ncbi:lytic transglycosylase domain-containing protein [Aquincola tertiaricarbonis]|uniref:Lytic transglycosylase domain-containing protein n=1 Tax=Aquincola tertiaricarbonis TaxID=391953 RepID=A0ABY4S1D3_AQUTE|nr:lytic transglycosylase domain-containing protein [Aquincola tertiaricarbonis]URI07216.1 lytic transglycosylase domain-containing protein [Aquincola tertiaricarbonis]
MPQVQAAMASWLGLVAWLAVGSAMAQATEGLACEGWTPAQRAKFRLTADEACARPAMPAPAASAATPAQRQALYLKLFEIDGTAVRALPPVAPVPPKPASVWTPSTQPVPGTAAPLSMKGRPALAPQALRAMQLAPLVDDTARRYDIDPLLLHAIAHVESRHQAQALSPAGARGLMQVMPTTARRFGLQAEAALSDPGANLAVSASYLKLLQRRFDGDLPLVLAAYNAGEGAVERHGRRIPPYAETQGYVQQVMQRYRWLAGFAPQALPALQRVAQP